jgi:hypothetical protein
VKFRSILIAVEEYQAAAIRSVVELAFWKRPRIRSGIAPGYRRVFGGSYGHIRRSVGTVVNDIVTIDTVGRFPVTRGGRVHFDEGGGTGGRWRRDRTGRGTRAKKDPFQYSVRHRVSVGEANDDVTGQVPYQVFAGAEVTDRPGVEQDAGATQNVHLLRPASPAEVPVHHIESYLVGRGIGEVQVDTHSGGGVPGCGGPVGGGVGALQGAHIRGGVDPGIRSVSCDGGRHIRRVLSRVVNDGVTVGSIDAFPAAERGGIHLDEGGGTGRGGASGSSHLDGVTHGRTISGCIESANGIGIGRTDAAGGVRQGERRVRYRCQGRAVSQHLITGHPDVVGTGGPGKIHLGGTLGEGGSEHGGTRRLGIGGRRHSYGGTRRGTAGTIRGGKCIGGGLGGRDLLGRESQDCPAAVVDGHAGGSPCAAMRSAHSSAFVFAGFCSMTVSPMTPICAASRHSRKSGSLDAYGNRNSDLGRFYGVRLAPAWTGGHTPLRHGQDVTA